MAPCQMSLLVAVFMFAFTLEANGIRHVRNASQPRLPVKPPLIDSFAGGAPRGEGRAAPWKLGEAMGLLLSSLHKPPLSSNSVPRHDGPAGHCPGARQQRVIAAAALAASPVLAMMLIMAGLLLLDRFFPESSPSGMVREGTFYMRHGRVDGPARPPHLVPWQLVVDSQPPLPCASKAA
mmetsp:Transcript_55575/g.173979  ORF Transcript_55575/g.173979 Transcript_55575/m.173979 type:complete len:179 (-) Transcript_55575:21-557(-)